MCICVFISIYIYFLSLTYKHIYIYLSKFIYIYIILFYTWLGERTQADTAQPKQIILLYFIYDLLHIISLLII